MIVNNPGIRRGSGLRRNRPRQSKFYRERRANRTVIGQIMRLCLGAPTLAVFCDLSRRDWLDTRRESSRITRGTGFHFPSSVPSRGRIMFVSTSVLAVRPRRGSNRGNEPSFSVQYSALGYMAIHPSVDF